MNSPIQNHRPTKIPLQIMLTVPFVAQMILIAGLVGYLSFRNGQQAVNDVARQLRTEINARIEQHLHTFLDTPHQINLANATMINQKILNPDDQTVLERHFWDQIRIFDSVTSIYFGNRAGGLADAGREGAAGTLYIIGTDNFASGPFRKYATDNRGNRAELLSTMPDFDARTRPWYTGAVDKGGPAWSEVYILFTGQDMAISASQPVYDAQQKLLGVTAVDLFLSHLSDFLARLKIGKTGQSFIMERSGLLIATSTGEKPFTAANTATPQRRIASVESAVPLTRGAAEALAQQFGNYQAITTPQQFEFFLDNQLQFAQVTPLQSRYGLDWLIVTVVPEADFMDQINANNRATLLLIGAALLLTIGLGILTARMISRPIYQLNYSAQAMARGDWQPPVVRDPVRVQELDQLTASFNHMSRQLQQTLENLTVEIAERKRTEEALQQSHHSLARALAELKETQNKMVQQERLAAVGQLAAGVAHDFNNILTSILGYAELLCLSPHNTPGVQDDLKKILTAGQRAAHLVRQLLDFSRKSVTQPKLMDLTPFVKEIVNFLTRTILGNIRLSLTIDPGNHFITADPTQIQQILTNLVVNARDAMPVGGNLNIRLSQLETDGAEKCDSCGQPIIGKWVLITVADTGSGIAPDVLPHIFEPFYTTKEVGMGSGLGLSQVIGIVAQHGGHLTVNSATQQGTIFSIYLPLAGQGQISTPEEPEFQPLRGNGETILLVEDEPAVREVSRALLETLNYRVLTAVSGREALTIVAEHQAEISLVLSDMVMPNIDGKILFQMLKEKYPDLKIVIMSGYPLGNQGLELLEHGVAAWIEKPLTLPQLSQVLNTILDQQTSSRKTP